VYRRLAWLLLLLVVGMEADNSRGDTSAGSSVLVAAAADLEPVLPAVVDQFRTQSGRAISVSYGSSATLTAQIENGAPFDLFLSADSGFPTQLATRGLTVGPPIPYARGTLVLWARNDAALPPLSMESLSDPGLKTLAIANPQHAPYGRAAVAALRSMGLYGKLGPKLRVAENVAQAAEFAESGNAQVGLISLTSALTFQLQREGHFVLVPPTDYPPIIQSAALLKSGRHAQPARALLNFMLSRPVRKELASRGLQPPR
jgi:molybdate transport system substrate-binding protein